MVSCADRCARVCLLRNALLHVLISAVLVVLCRCVIRLSQVCAA